MTHTHTPQPAALYRELYHELFDRIYDKLYERVYGEVLQTLGDELLDGGVDMDDAELIVNLLLEHERERKAAEGRTP